MWKENKKLYPIQQQAVEEGLMNPRILYALSTGIGKSAISINLMEQLKEQGRAQNILVLVPAALKTNFKENIEKFTKGNDIYLIDSDTSSKFIGKKTKEGEEGLRFFVVSYSLFRRDPMKYINFGENIIDSIILDECDRARDLDTKTSQAIMEVSDKVSNFVGLTGSSINNSPGELVNIMQAITGKQFPIENQKEFEERFMTKITVRGVNGLPKEELRLKNVEDLKELFDENIFFFDEKSPERGFPQVEMKDIKTPMSKFQMTMYEAAMGNISPEIKKKLKQNKQLSETEGKHLFSLIAKARAVSGSIAGMDESISQSQAAVQSPKVKALIDSVEKNLAEAPDNKVLVYSNLIKGGIETIAQGLKDRGIEHGIFVGKGRMGIDEKLRDQAVQDFRSGKKRVILLSPAGGEGLSLKNTTHIKIFDPAYNPEKTNQAIARGVRVGGLAHRPISERKVQVEKYQSTLPRTFLQKVLRQEPRSIDQWISTIAENKAQLNKEFKQILAGKERIKRLPRETRIVPKKIKHRPLEYTFGLKKPRKTRSDKGRKRGPYRERLM